MPALYANRAFSTLASGITNVATSLTVATGHGARFPAITGSDYFYATLDDNAGNVEVVKVTARSTDVFTIVRAQDGTSALAFSTGAAVELRVVKALFDDIKFDAVQNLTLLNLPSSAFKKSVKAATTANITLSGAQTIDGVSIVAGDRVLVKNQTTASQNGIYNASASTWTRSVDADTSDDIGSAIVSVDQGAVHGGDSWTTSFKTTDTLGTTAMSWYELVYNTGTWGISTTGSAATLTTARTLWGQSFDGSANVTGALSGVTTIGMSGQLTNSVAVGTAPFVITSTTRVANLNVATAGTADTLTTARTLTIGSTGKTFNGSANVSWTLAEIGALALTGGTLTGSLTISTTAPLIVFAETDQTLPAGRRRLVLDGNVFTLRRNTAAAGDFSTETNDFSVDASSNFTATGNVTAYSDERLKKDWRKLSDDFVDRLAGVKSGSYTRIDTGSQQVGVSAQSLRSVLPEAVLDDDNYLSVAYGNAAMASAVELAKRVVAQGVRIAKLEALIDGLMEGRDG